jgi:hypothetical protein
MAVERFDSGGVLARRSPVLAFAASARPAPSKPPRPRAEPASSPRLGEPTEGALPIIPRIVHRTAVADRAAFRVRGVGALGARVAGALRASVLGRLAATAAAMVVVGATLGAASGWAMRALTDRSVPASPPDAVAVERPLARANVARVEHVAPVPPPEEAPPAPPVSRVAAHLPPTPAHSAPPAFAHAARAPTGRRPAPLPAPRKAAPSAKLAHR